MSFKTICAVLTAFIFALACASQKAEEPGGSTMQETALKVGTCTEFTSKNSEHVSAKRAEVYKKYSILSYVKTIGSGEDLGSLSSTALVTVSETSPGYFVKGKCPAEPPSDFVSIGDASEGIAFDGKGFMFVTSSKNGKILKIDQQGNIAVFAQGLNTPEAIAFDKNGNLWLAEYGGYVKQYSPAGELLLNMGGFSGPNGIAVHGNGTVYMSDCKSYDVYQIKNGVKKSMFKLNSFGSMPNGMALNADQSILYLLDTQTYGNGAIYKVSLNSSGDYVSKTKISLKKPMLVLDGIALDVEGKLYVTYNKKDIAKVDPLNGEVTPVYESKSIGNDLSWPANIAFGYGPGFDSKSIYITQVGIAVGETPTENNKKIKKYLIGKECMILPIFN